MTDLNKQELRRFASSLLSESPGGNGDPVPAIAMSAADVLSLLDEIDRLSFEPAKHSRRLIEQLRAEIESLRKDADRYRWLRCSDQLEGCAFSAVNEWLWADGGFEAVTSAIDTAMAGEGNANG